MKALQAMRKLGFRKWYERALLRSHGHLVILIACAVAILGAAEAFSSGLSIGSQFALIACVLASAVIGLWALKRYFYLLHHAEFIADQAVCAQCQAYGKWDITGEDPTARQMRVCCRKCGNLWNIAL